MLVFLKGAVCDASEQAGVVRQGADVAPVDLVWLAVEVICAEVCQTGDHFVDFCFLPEEGAHRSSLVSEGFFISW